MHFPKTQLRHTLFLFLLFMSLPAVAADYFWVGGSGNWSDISHWATTSGGNFTHSQAPTAGDDVFFDANSFSAPGQVVSFNTDINFCRSFSSQGVTNNPVLQSGGTVTLNVFGGWLMDASMTLDFNGHLVFSSDQPDTPVNFAGQGAGATISFAGTGGWRLDSPVTVDSTFSLNEGTLNTNDQPITCGYFHSDGDANRTLNLSASQVSVVNATYRPYENAPLEFEFHPLWLDARNLTINPGTSVITLLGDDVDIIVEGPGTIDLNIVSLAAPMGDSRIRDWVNYNGGGTSPTLNFTGLSLAHKTELAAAFTAGVLTLFPGQAYQFFSGYTFTVGDLVATGNCRAGIDLMSTQSGEVATLSSVNTITTDFVSLQSIAATGGGTFVANDAVDFGNNPGWTINLKPTQDFYWIGNTGNWNEPMNWSATSGGPPSGCIPSVVDNVFFDGNSFSGPGQTVTLDVENAYCRNLDWTGATGTPVFTGPEDHQLRVSGSLTFIDAMEHTFVGDYLFSSITPGNTITSAGHRFNQNVTFDGSGGWILQDSFFVYRYLWFNAGTLQTNDQAINTQFFRSEGRGQRTLEFGNSYVTIESRNNMFYYSELNFFSENMTFDAGTSTVEFTGGNSGGGYLNGPERLDFNVVLFTCPYGRWYNNLYNPNTGSQLAAATDSILYYNSGSLGGANEINYCYFSPGRTYELGNRTTQTIVELDASGSCEEGSISLISDFVNEPATLSLSPGHVSDRIFIKGIEVTGGAPATATNAVDSGNNVGWNFSAAAPRTLYWVGGNGNWFDVAHWSLTSGGPGGECIPTAIDDVFFDANSDLDGDDFLRVDNDSDRSIYCHDITWEGVPNQTFEFIVGIVRLTGSLRNDTNLNYYSSPTFFYGSGEQTIDPGGAYMNTFIVDNDGHHTITSNVSLYELSHQRGDITFAMPRIEAYRYIAIFGTVPKRLNMGSTYVTLIGESTGFWEAMSIYSDANLTIDPGTSTVDFTAASASIRADLPVSLHDVVFSNPDGTGRIFSDQFATSQTLTANEISFFGNGRLDLEVTTDTLLFAPGKAYIFAAEKTQTINRFWQTIGNNCVPISLSSSILGTQALASVPPTGEILADFIQMQNITGVGGADFLAGSRSTDIANSNINWTFETAPQFQEVGFLGEDRALCEGEPVTLNAYNFSPGETYRWSDGSTDTTFTTNQSGTYFVEVTFETSCVIRDTVVILDVQNFNVDLGQDPTICAGETFTFDADVGLNNADYEWQDGSTESSFTATVAGEYYVTVDLGGCQKTDTIFLNVTPLPTVDLGPDQIACAGESFTLTPDISAESVRWQDGSTGPTFSSDQPGIYWIEGTNGNCTVRDSIEVTYVDAGAVNLGSDTTVCTSNELLLDAGVAGVNYTWQDGSSSQTFRATETGQYFVEIEISGCTAADTINVTFPDLPVIDLADNYEACLGEVFLLTTTTPADSYNWSNGQTGPDFSTSTSAGYTLSVDVGPCTLTKDFTVDFLAPPVVALGNDTLLCTANSFTIDAGQVGTWQDGTTASSLTVTTSGTYHVTVTNAACTVRDTIVVSFANLDGLMVAGNYEACVGEPFTLTAPVAAEFYRWNNGQTGPVFSTSIPGTYELTAVIGPCVLQETFTVGFLDPPVVDLGPDESYCQGTMVDLDAGQAGSWQDGSTQQIFTATAPGLYRVTVSNGGCTVSDSIELTFLDLPEFSLGEDQTGCEGDVLTVTVPTGLGTIRWNDDSTDVVRNFTESGTFSVAITDGNGCVGQDTVALTIAPPPFLDLGPDTTVCDNLPFSLTPAFSDGTITWPDGSTGTQYPVPNPGLIIARIDNGACINTDSVQIAFRECVFFQAYLPTGFSPNDDGINDAFRPLFDDRLEITDYQFQVFGRWGELLFSTQDPTEGWDGSSRSRALGTGVFTYAVNVSYVDDAGPGSEVLAGQVTLVR